MTDDKSKNEQLYDRVMKAIKELFSDTSVDVEQTIANLQALNDEIEDRLESLEGR